MIFYYKGTQMIYLALTLFNLNLYEEALQNCEMAESFGIHQKETQELMDKILSKMYE